MRYSTVTPQQKIESVANRLGIPGIARQQGSTRIIYDSLPLDGKQEFRFFEGAGSRQYPFTNLGSFGNKLEVGETLSVQYAYLSVFKITNNIVTTIDPVGLVAPFVPIALGDMNFSIGNVQVVKPFPVLSMNPAFNKNGNSDSNLFLFDTDLVIPPLLEFVANLKIQAVIPDMRDYYLRLTIEGIGSLVNTRQTY